jgi:hypothetical protein
MTNTSDIGASAPQTSSRRRLLRAMLCLGHPKLKPWMCWVFFIPQLILYLYWLGPVFVYYVKGVPPEASLQTITGVWGEKGGMQVDGFAPRYFVDTTSGPREVHCGFPGQGVLCGDAFTPRPQRGKRVTVHYDSYFGILAFENLDSPVADPRVARMSYELGVRLYAQPKDTLYGNHVAHVRLGALFVLYLGTVFSCWQAARKSLVPSKATD